MIGDVGLRDVEDADLDVFFVQQDDPEASAMAAFPGRDREHFLAHWARIRADDGVVQRTILADGVVAGNIGCWHQDGQAMIGYWVGREFWGQGVGTRAIGQFLGEVAVRPLHAEVAAHNAGSIRVLEKNGFRRAGSEVAEDGVELHLFVLGA